jgi:hypothetical protein
MPEPSRFHARSMFRCWLALALVIAATGAPAQEFEAPPPSKPDGMHITFLPPPLRGVITVGIYEPGGRLVRVLHREATEKAFTIGLNGFITKWNGLADGGEPAPTGKYLVRGWMVGDLDVEGVAFHGNDWVTEDGPRFTTMVRLKQETDGAWKVVLKDEADAEHPTALEMWPAEPGESGITTVVANGVLTIQEGGERATVMLDEGEKILHATSGFGGQAWAIVETPTGREVRSFAANGEFLRRLAYRPEEPAPVELVASLASDKILLLERNATEQRLRVLAHAESAQGVSTWKTLAQKRILACGTFEQIAPHLGKPAPNPVPAVKVTTKQNPLLQNAKTDVNLQVRANAEGAELVTDDGLPLLQLTERKGLKWAVLVPEGKKIRLFQSDGVQVDEFRIGRPENLMSFDAGDYTLKR